MDDMLGVLIKTVDRLLIAQGADPTIVPDTDKLFIAAEHVEVVAMNLLPTPQEVASDPVSRPEPV